MTTQKEIVLEAHGLSKTFGERLVVDMLSLQLHKGEILGLLGPNGAGKTTTVQMLLGILTPSAGEISYFGKPFSKHRTDILERVGFSSSYVNLPWNLTVWECLTFISYLYDIPKRRERVAQVISLFNLEQLSRQQLVELSSGQLTRVNLAKAFLNEPQVLLLDEPTASLDVDVAASMRELLRERQRAADVSVLLTSHNMAEVEELCDRVVFINEGHIVADDTPEKLAGSIEISHVELRSSTDLERIQTYCTTHHLPFRLHHRSIVIDIHEKNIPSLLRDLAQDNISYEEISIEKPTLEDFFLQTLRAHPPEGR